MIGHLDQHPNWPQDSGDLDLPEVLARFEPDAFALGYLYLGTSFDVPPHAVLAGTRFENTEPPNLNTVVVQKGFLQTFSEQINNLKRDRA